MNRKTGTWKWNKYHALTLFFVLFTVLSLGGSAFALDEQEGDIRSTNAVNEIEDKVQTESDYAWVKAPMEDVLSGREFTLEEYASTGSPVVIHIFAIWCSICTLQLQESSAFQKAYPDKATIIGIDIDDTESSEAILRHVLKNDLIGTFAAAPQEVSMGLIAAFGPLVVLQIPQTIVIVDKDIFHLGPGLIPTSGLAQIIEEVEATHALME